MTNFEVLGEVTAIFDCLLNLNHSLFVSISWIWNPEIHYDVKLINDNVTDVSDDNQVSSCCDLSQVVSNWFLIPVKLSSGSPLATVTTGPGCDNRSGDTLGHISHIWKYLTQ